MLLVTKIFVLLLASATACDQDEEKFMYLMQDLTKLLNENGLRDIWEMDDNEVMGEIKMILEDNGFDSEKLLADEQWAAVNFAKQISCYQGRTTNILIAGIYAYKYYNGYGCYCGGGNYFGNYVDATDKCCMEHDHCYHSAQIKYGLKKGCHTYTTPYNASCCSSRKITKCTDTGPSAARDLCVCDQIMAECLAKKSTLDSYNSKYMDNRKQCKDTPESSKPYTLAEIISTCKNYSAARKKYKQTVASQGKCPNTGGWFLGRRR